MSCLAWVALMTLLGYLTTIVTVAIAGMILYRRDRWRFVRR